MVGFPDDSGKRYHTFSRYLLEKFGQKCVKIPLDGGFTCPNRDGTKGFGGCVYCGGGGAESLCDGSRTLLPLREQYEQGRAGLEKKWGRAPVIACFSSYTSTYAPAARLRPLYDEVLALPDVVGLTISTRADALPDEVIDLLTEYAAKTVLTVELGLQSVHDETAARIHRGHTYAEFAASYDKLKACGIPVCVHLINGLPGETPEMMRRSAEVLGSMRPDFVKFHELYIRRDAPIANAYLRGEVPLLSRAEYVEILADQIERLPPETVVERLTGDPLRTQCLAPDWALDKKKTRALLDKTLEKRGTFQGFWYNCTKSD